MTKSFNFFFYKSRLICLLLCALIRGTWTSARGVLTSSPRSHLFITDNDISPLLKDDFSTSPYHSSVQCMACLFRIIRTRPPWIHYEGRIIPMEALGKRHVLHLWDVRMIWNSIVTLFSGWLWLYLIADVRLCLCWPWLFKDKVLSRMFFFFKLLKKFNELALKEMLQANNTYSCYL